MNDVKTEISKLLGVICSLTVFILFTGCDSWKSDPPDEIHTISITNQTECSLLIVLDDTQYIELLNYNATDQFENIESGDHVVQAFRWENEILGEEVGRIEIFVSDRKDYFWTIQNCIP